MYEDLFLPSHRCLTPPSWGTHCDINAIYTSLNTTPYYIIHDKKKILPRRMSTTACSFASHFGQEMAQNADLQSCRVAKFSRGDNPEPPPCDRTQGCSVSRLPLFWLTQLSDSSRAPARKSYLYKPVPLALDLIWIIIANLLTDVSAMECARLRAWCTCSRQMASEGWYRSQWGDGVW